MRQGKYIFFIGYDIDDELQLANCGNDELMEFDFSGVINVL